MRQVWGLRGKPLRGGLVAGISARAVSIEVLLHALRDGCPGQNEAEVVADYAKERHLRFIGRQRRLWDLSMRCPDFTAQKEQ